MYLDGLIFLITQHVIGLLAIGPCTALVIRNSISNRTKGLYTVFGTTLGSFSIKTLSVLGLSLLLMHSPNLLGAFKIAGACFLIYLGVKSLWCAYKEFQVRKNDKSLFLQDINTKKTPFISGYLMSMANPMSSVRFIAIFSTAITPETPLVFQISYLIVLAIISFVFYSLMALFFSTEAIQRNMVRFRYILSAILGATLIFWGLKIL